MIDGDSAWGSPTFNHPDIVQGTMRTRKQTPLLTLEFHIFPGVLVAMALRLTGASAEQRTIVLIAGLIVATFIIFATRSYFKVKSSSPID
jgi:hypothetical protein